MTIVAQGTLNLASLIVPDLYLVIVPPQVILLNGVPTNVLGVVGTASWGPVNTPVLVSDMPTQVRNFGSPVNRKYDLGTHVAVAVQQGAQNMRCVRVTDGTDTAATITSPSGCIVYTALYTGSAGNALTVTLSTGSKASTFKAVVAVAGGVPEIYDNIAGTGNAFWVNLASAINLGNGPLRPPSSLIVATALAGVTAPSASTVTLVGGTDGGVPGVGKVTAATLVGTDTTPRKGMYALRGLGCSILDMCDADDSTQWTTIDGFALNEGMYAIQTGPSGDTITNAISTKNSAGLDSYSTKMMFGNWVLWNDPFNQVQRYVSPQGFIAGRLANLSPHLTTLNKTLYGIIGTQLTVSQSGSFTTFSTAELQSLIQAGIDTITNPGGGGLIMWTARSGHNSSSNAAVRGDNYTRMINFIAATLNSGMGLYLGRPITQDLCLQVKATINSFLLALLGQGMLGASVDDRGLPFGVACDLGPGTNNPPFRTKLGYFVCDVQVQFLSINEYFILNLEGGQTVSVTRQSQNTPIPAA
jgi:phage tail sheath protein FI